MEDKLLLDIVTPSGPILTEEVDEVVASGSEGEFGVMPGHIPFVTILKIGMLHYKKGDVTQYVFVNSGYAEVGPNKVLILADSAERSDEIDVERAREAMKRAEERFKKEKDLDFKRAEVALERALARIHVAEKH